MTDRRIDSFFYGLFMDEAILLDKQVIPVNPRPAFVEGFQLRIGHRATLFPHVGARAYGMLFAVRPFRLYVTTYPKRPRLMSATWNTRRACKACCAN